MRGMLRALFEGQCHKVFEAHALAARRFLRGLAGVEVEAIEAQGEVPSHTGSREWNSATNRAGPSAGGNRLYRIMKPIRHPPPAAQLFANAVKKSLREGQPCPFGEVLRKT